MTGACVTSSCALCGLLLVSLRCLFRRALAAIIFLRSMSVGLVLLGYGMVNAGEVKRISSTYKDLGNSQKVYLHAGLISVLEFPQNIIEVRIGNPGTLKVQLSQVSPKELTLFLVRQSVEPTNLIVKSEKRFYVFDIIPSRTSHQDYLKISGAFGGPSLASTELPTRIESLAPKSKSQGRLLETIQVGGD